MYPVPANSGAYEAGLMTIGELACPPQHPQQVSFRGISNFLTQCVSMGFNPNPIEGAQM